MTDDYIVKPVAKALRTLIVLSEAERELSLAELCRRVDIPKTTVFRYLQTFVAYNLVRHDSRTDRYSLGMQLWSLGQLAMSTSRLREVAIRPMEVLRDQFDETINLGVLDGNEIVYIEMAESRRSLRMQARLGGRDPVYSTALGRAILAFLSEENWPDHLPSDLLPRTPSTISSLAALRGELLNTRRRGYAVDNCENEENARCVGAPIRDGRGGVIAGISLSAPASRFDEVRIDEVGTAVTDTARKIESLIGHGGQTWHEHLGGPASRT